MSASLMPGENTPNLAGKISIFKRILEGVCSLDASRALHYSVRREMIVTSRLS